MNINRKFLFKLLVVWIFISAFYYLPNFISGDLLADRSTNFAHKVTKYLVSFAISVLLMFAYGSFKLLFVYLATSIYLAVAIILLNHDFNVYPMIDVLVVITSFIGFAFVSSHFNSLQQLMIVKAIVYSGILISLISFFEYFYMWPVLGDYWMATGGYRSVSTLLNPNNLGIYLGAALLLLFSLTKHTVFLKVLFSIIIFTALLMTGSRTAFLSLICAGSIFYLLGGEWGFFIKRLVIFSLSALFFILASWVFVVMGIFSLPERAFDFYTATIRLEKYFSYLINIDHTYILPDFYGYRIIEVSESGYFNYLNALGIPAAFMLFFYVLYFLFSSKAGRLVLPKGNFGIIFLYYLVAMIFENVLMSFPNNQLFFIALGASIASAVPSLSSRNEN